MDWNKLLERISGKSRAAKKRLHGYRSILPKLRTDQVSDEEVIRAIRSIPTHFTGIAHVQDWGSSLTGGASSLQSAGSGSGVTAGNFLVCTICHYNNGNFGTPVNVSTVADTLGNSFSFVGKKIVAGLHGQAEIWAKANCAGGASGAKVTVTWTATNNGGAFGTSEFSGVDASGTLDSGYGTSGVQVNTALMSASSPCPGSSSTTNANDLLVLVYGTSAGSGMYTISQPTGFSEIYHDGAATTSIEGAGAYQIYTSTQAGINPAFSSTDVSASNTFGCVAAAFKAAAATGSPWPWFYDDSLNGGLRHSSMDGIH